MSGSSPHPPQTPPPSSPSLLFAATLAFNLLTKGFIGLVFPLAFVFLYLLITRQLKTPPQDSTSSNPSPSSSSSPLPWHILAAIRNPAIPMPPGLGLPARAGWAWFYLYNEHIARFLGRRIPPRTTARPPIWLFWLYAVPLDVSPGASFLPAAIARTWRQLGHRYEVTIRQREAALTVTHLVPHRPPLFFTLSSRQGVLLAPPPFPPLAPPPRRPPRLRRRPPPVPHSSRLPP